jgi:hypothetical protein
MPKKKFINVNVAGKLKIRLNSLRAVMVYDDFSNSICQK